MLFEGPRRFLARGLRRGIMTGAIVGAAQLAIGERSGYRVCKWLPRPGRMGAPLSVGDDLPYAECRVRAPSLHAAKTLPQIDFWREP